MTTRKLELVDYRSENPEAPDADRLVFKNNGDGTVEVWTEIQSEFDSAIKLTSKQLKGLASWASYVADQSPKPA